MLIWSHFLEEDTTPYSNWFEPLQHHAYISNVTKQLMSLFAHESNRATIPVDDSSAV